MATTSDEAWAEAVDYALTKMVDASGMDVAFGARVASGGRRLVISRVRGAQTTALQDLVVHRGTGLGGKALVLKQPVTVTDYVRAKGISHHYDHAVTLEGIHSIVAVPLRVSGSVTGVLYAALRQRLGIGERVQRLVASIAREGEQRLASRLWPGSSGKRENAWLPDISVELGLIIEQVENPDIRAGLEAIRDRLAAPRPDHAGLSVLSERELQALRYAALGLSNAEIAERMGLVAGTVKAYLRSVMRKLDSHNRMAAVNTARALGYPL